MTEITESDVMPLVKKYLELSFPKVCRHYVVLDLLSLLESKGCTFPEGLVAAVVAVDDDTALKLMKNE